MIRSLLSAAGVALLALWLPYGVFIPVHYVIKLIWTAIFR